MDEKGYGVNLQLQAKPAAKQKRSKHSVHQTDTSQPTQKATTRSKVSRTNSSKVIKLATAPALKTLTEGDEDLKRQFIASKETASYPISQFKEVKKSKDGKYQFKVIKKGKMKEVWVQSEDIPAEYSMCCELCRMFHICN